MRIWSLHPKYIDSKGLVALWRETLLAQHVLLGKTKGYKNHPQLERFKAHQNPVAAIGAYLAYVQEEASLRGYNFDATKIEITDKNIAPIEVTDGQLAYELTHLKNKLQIRDEEKFLQIELVLNPDLHPIFTKITGGIADWERV